MPVSAETWKEWTDGHTELDAVATERAALDARETTAKTKIDAAGVKIIAEAGLSEGETYGAEPTPATAFKVVGGKLIEGNLASFHPEANK